MIRSKLKYTALVAASLLLNAQLIFAADTTSNTTGAISIPNPSSFPDLESVINTLSNLVRPIVILVLVAMLMYGGWVRLTARDDSKKVENSSKIMTAAIVGFGIIVLAPVIVRFVGSLLGVQGGLLDFGGV